MIKNIIRCKNCNDVFCITGYEDSPEYIYDTENDEIYEKVIQSEKDVFIQRHKGHELEKLKMKRDSYISESRYSEPIKTCYYEVSNGFHNYILKRWRNDINSPMRYELLRGNIEIEIERVEIDEINIKKSIEDEFPQISQYKILSFIKVIENSIARIAPEEIEGSHIEGQNPLISYGILRRGHINIILLKSKRIFGISCLDKVRRFLLDNFCSPVQQNIRIIKKFRLNIESESEIHEIRDLVLNRQAIQNIFT